MTNVCQSSFTDSDIAKNMTLGRTKATSIIKNVTGKKQHAIVCELLKNNTFSLCVDESTDLSNMKSLCLVVRVFVDYQIHDLFFGLLNVDQCDAKSLYNLVVDQFNRNSIDYKRNMIGFAADGASYMYKCICHSLALCSSYACLQLPSAVETLARNIFNYISNSPKRCNLYKEIQKLLDIRPKKMLHPSQTRWLSLESVVIRILELYEPLKIYFPFAANNFIYYYEYPAF
ncbi:uncharacterized protein LOC133328445 [Musca vetustissima]|uniref:uncharacterized protein LOC133328445 n=1 Tax=Musca vetustissima TaxID=27455 RepID=UPI002AB6AB0B|nr:uncharacterized protein LOC133328445 [Musca vetustissima]